MDKKHKCAICRKSYTGFGNNAEPITSGRCCDKCNASVVIPARLRKIQDAEYGLEVQKALIKEDVKKMTRYFFWDWCKPYGWRQSGRTDGYKSIKELEKGLGVDLNADNWKILKAEIVKAKKI